MRRIAVIDREKCRPDKCGLECVKYCPVNRSGGKVVYIDEDDKMRIVEELCTGCGMCVKKCPFSAINIVRLPEPAEGDEIFRYEENGFLLCRLPLLRPGKVVGLLGQNGVGKSTVLKILSGKLKINFGDPKREPNPKDIISMFRGSELQQYFEKLLNGEIKISIKPERVDLIPKIFPGKVRDLLREYDDYGAHREVAKTLEIYNILDSDTASISGGELQSVAVAVSILRKADVYLFDEPTNYLDVFQRMKIARMIRNLAAEKSGSVLVVEHDLAVLDYLSDYVHVLYGVPGAYGIVSNPYGVREGINIFLRGFLPDENVRFRPEPITFKRRPSGLIAAVEKVSGYSEMYLKYEEGFELTIEQGELRAGETIVCVGPNGIGKTTFVKLIAGIIKPVYGEIWPEKLKVAYKPQYLRRDYEGTVRSVLSKALRKNMESSFFKSEILNRLNLTAVMDRKVNQLSGGELQRVAIALTLGRDADIYLIDEPSAFLDVEMRYAAAKAIKRRVEGTSKVCIVVEHDILLVESIADRIILFTGEPGLRGHASQPLTVHKALNTFLKLLDITFRRDPETGRARVNKPGSRLDRLARETGEYFYTPTSS